jgi:DNA primase
VQKLLRQTDDLVFSFDGDAAGRKGAWRALESSLPALTDGKQVRFLFLPQGDDPDTYVRRVGKDGFESAVERALPLSRYLLERLSAEVDLSSAEGRASLIHAAKPLVTQLQNNTFRVQVIHDLADKAHLTPSEVESLCGLAAVARTRSAAPPRARVAPANPLWRKMMRLVLDMPQIAERITPNERALLEADAEYAPVIDLMDRVRATGVSTTGALLETVRGTAEAELYAQIASEGLEGLGDAEEARADFAGILQKLELSSVEREYQELLGRAEKTSADEARLGALSTRMRELKAGPSVGAVPPQ